MPRLFETEYIGKFNILSHFCRCDGCRRLTLLSTYTTTRFAKLLGIPFLPLGRFKMVDECPQCGTRGVVRARKYDKERKRNLSLMMDGFASEADNPQNCAHALHTLMVYDMKSWFQDVQKSYGLRFETNMQIQYLIAQGLSRFGKYREAMAYCRKAIVLGAGQQAEELLKLCGTLLEASEGTKDQDALRVQPESTLRAYIPLACLTSVVVVGLAAAGVSSLRNYKAWIVNGSLQTYSFALDDQVYELAPGSTKQITLRLGNHELKTDDMPTKEFTYSVPLIKQLLDKHQLVINPDAMALLAISETGKVRDASTTFSSTGQIRVFPGLSTPPHGIRKINADTSRKESIGLYRPESHMAMVELMNRLGLETAAVDYARRALRMNPASDESPALLPVALKQYEPEEALAFLREGLSVEPTLLPWHRHYQNYVQLHLPEHNLEREYTQRCNAHSDDPASYYLLARVVENRQNAYRLFEHADENHAMDGLGLYAIAHDLYIRGRFQQALPYSKSAMAADPENTDFNQLNEHILLALRDYDALLAKTLEAKHEQPSRARVERKVLYLTLAGFHQEAAREIAKEDHSAVQSRLNAVRFYAVGNVDDYLGYMADLDDPHAGMETCLHRDQIAQADELVSRKEDHPYWEHLVLYCAAMNRDQTEIAQRNLQKALAEAGSDTMARRTITRLLSGEEAFTEEAIRALDIEASEKTVLCAALGYRFPENRDQANALARLYNFIPAYPQLLVKQWTRPASASGMLSRRSSSRAIQQAP